MSTFKRYDDVAAVETDPETRQPKPGGKVKNACVDLTGGMFVRVRFENGTADAFIQGSGWHFWGDTYRQRLVPVCCRASCDRPVLVPVLAPDDPLGRQWCSEDCRDDDAERAGGAMAPVEYSSEFD